MSQGTHLKSRGKLLSEASAELQRHQRQKSRKISSIPARRSTPLVGSSKRSSESAKLRQEKKLKILRHELSRSVVHGAQSGSGASENASEIQQLRHERASLTSQCGSLDTETQGCQKCSQFFFEVQVAHIPRVRGMLDVERQKLNTLQADVVRLKAEKKHTSQRRGCLATSLLQRILALSPRCILFGPK